MRIIKDRTYSLCDVCCKEVPAVIYEENGRVYLRKSCGQHGDFTGLVEKDPEYYKRFAHIKPRKLIPFSTLVVPVTYRCNMNCRYCYAPEADRADMTPDEFERIINSTKSPEIGISGGEPTLRDDLATLIAMVKRAGKEARLLTNGIKLADARYLKKLKKAGLDSVFFSFDSFKKDFYGAFKGAKGGSIDILGLKLKALLNIEKEDIPTSFSVTIYPRINDDELMDLFAFALERNHYVDCLRFRSCFKIGRSSGVDGDGYFGSEILDLFSKAVNIDKRRLLDEYLIDEDHSPHRVFLELKGYVRNKRFFPAPKVQKRGIFSMLGKEPPANKMRVRFINWPTIKNIDLQELENGIGQVTRDGKEVNFCQAIVLDNVNR
jgi:molybdenum cofactor biosynthesis enzyme MoaA